MLALNAFVIMLTGLAAVWVWRERDAAWFCARWLKVLLAILGVALVTAIILRRHGFGYWRLAVGLAVYEESIVWNTALGLISFALVFTARTAFVEKPRRTIVLPAALCILLAAMIVIEWSTARPIAGELTERVDKDGAILQSSGTSCAPAAAANLLRSFGLRKTEREMAILFRTTPSGTTDECEKRRFESLGFVCRFLDITNHDLAQVTPPAMLGTELAGSPPIPHSIALFGWVDGKALICDPMSGQQLLTKRELQERWRGVGLEIRLPGVEPALTNVYYRQWKRQAQGS